MATLEHSFSRHGVDAVYAAVTDPEHLKRRCAHFKQRNIECTSTVNGDVTEVRLARDIESDIPSFAKKVVDAVNRVSVTLRWRADGDGRKATYDVAVNSRISISGTITLRPAGAGCRYQEQFQAKVAIPLLGGKIASLVEKETDKGVRADLEFTERELG